MQDQRGDAHEPGNLRAYNTLQNPPHNRFEETIIIPNKNRQNSNGNSHLNSLGPEISRGPRQRSGPAQIRLDPVADHASPQRANADHDAAHNHPAVVRPAQKDLGNVVSMKMTENQFGLDVRKPSISDANLRSLVDRSRIRQTLEGISDELLEYIVEDAPKSFAITLLAIRDPSKRHSAMKAFQNHSFTDRNLPVAKLNAFNSELCNVGLDDDYRTKCDHNCHIGMPRICEGIHVAKLDAFHHEAWDSMSFADFWEKQWGFLLHKFDLDQFEYDDMDENVILPLVPSKLEEDGKAGYFSEVLQAEMPVEMLLNVREKLDLVPFNKALTTYTY